MSQIAGALVESGTTGGGGGAVSSVSNADGTVTVAPTTGAVVVSLPAVGEAATTGDASHVAQITTDAEGRVSTAAAVAIVIAQTAVTGLVAALNAKAPLTSPTFTGTPAAPTNGTPTDNTTQIATDAFVQSALGAASPQPLASIGPAGGTAGVCLGATMPRAQVSSGAISANSGTLYLAAVYLAEGVTVTKLGWVAGGTGATAPTHQWLGLYDLNRVQLATTADQTSAPVVANTAYQYAIATIASGAATSFTTTYAGLYYIGLMMTATTTVSLVAGAGGVNASVAANGIAPIAAGPSTTGGSAPPTFPFTAGAITPAQQTLFLWAA